MKEFLQGLVIMATILFIGVGVISNPNDSIGTSMLIYALGPGILVCLFVRLIEIIME